MAEYRLHELDKGAHMTKLPKLFHRGDDAQAVEHAKNLLDGRDAELWRGAQLVATLRVSERK